MAIEYMRFRPVKKVGSLIGKASFKFNGLSFTEIDVHRRLNPNGKPLFRVRYIDGKSGEPSIFPDKNTQEDIDLEISCYILANYPQLKEIK